MLSKIGQTLRSFVTGDTDDGVRRPSKRSRTSIDDDDDIVETPAKKSRFTSQDPRIPNPGSSSNSWLPFNKVAELFVRGKQSIGESFILRALSKIGSGSNQDSEMSKAPNDGACQNFRAPPPAFAGRGLYGTGAERAAPRVGYVDMPGFYMTPPAPMQHGFDGGFKMPFGKPGAVGHRTMQQQQQQPHLQFASGPRYNGGAPMPRSYRSVYEKTYRPGASGKAAWGVNRSISQNETTNGTAKNKMAAKESIRLDERNRYAELLRQFSSSRLLDTAVRGGSYSHHKAKKDRGEETTVLGSKIERSASHDSSLSRSSRSSSETPVIHVQPNKSQTKPATTVSTSPGLTHRSFAELKSLRKPAQDTSQPSSRLQNGTDEKGASALNQFDYFTPASSRQQHTVEDRYRTPTQPKFREYDGRDSPLEIVKVVEPVRIQLRSPSTERFESALRDSPFLDDTWIRDLHSKYSTDPRNRSIVEQEVTVAFAREKRADLDELLQARLKKRLTLHEKSPAVLEEKFDDEEEDESDEFPELTDEMQDMVNNALQGRMDGEVLCEGFRLRITRKDLKTLDGLNWLNDEVINFYMELLMERGALDNFPKVHAFNSFFYPKIMSGGQAAVKRWTRKVDVFSVDYIVIPVHLGMHWCLAVVDFAKKQIKYFDSMGGRNTACLSGLRDYLVAESMDKRKKPFDMSDWTMEIMKNIPQQMNGSDCGVFACKFAEYSCRGAEMTFTQENMPYFRRRMVYEILSKKLL